MPDSRTQGAEPRAVSVAPARSIRTYAELGALADEWNALALAGGSLFLTHEWLDAWWSAFGQGERRWIVLCDEHGCLRAGGCLHPTRAKGLASPTNAHSGHWDVVARDESARAELWEAIIQTRPRRLHLQGLHERAPGTRALCEQLDSAGYRTILVPGSDCPWVALPDSWDQVIGSVKGKLRSEIRRRRRLLEREGTLTFRTTTGGPTLEQDLKQMLTLEASGWKGRSGTAILSHPSTQRLYRSFARSAAARGWLRLRFLELDGEPIAADYGCVFGSEAVAIKVGVSEAHRRAAPGVLLLAEVLRAAIEEGVQSYDFLGDADPFKADWTSDMRPRVRIWSYSQGAHPGALYRERLRPLLKSARDRARPADSRR